MNNTPTEKRLDQAARAGSRGVFTGPYTLSLTYAMPQTQSIILSSLHWLEHIYTHRSTQSPVGRQDPQAQLVQPNVRKNCRRDFTYHRRQCRDCLGTSRSGFISPQGTNTNLGDKLPVLNSDFLIQLLQRRLISWSEAPRQLAHVETVPSQGTRST